MYNTLESRNAAATEDKMNPGRPPFSVLIVDGQNNHAWQKTSPLLKKYLEDTKLFTVDVATTKTDKMPDPDFKPDFSKYREA